MPRRNKNRNWEAVLAAKTAAKKNSVTSRSDYNFSKEITIHYSRIEEPTTFKAGRREFCCLVYTFLSALTLLALLSYEESEDPHLTASPPFTTNWLGKIGLHFASTSFLLLGPASYLIPLFLFLGSVFSLTNRNFSQRLYLLQVSCSVVTASGLINWWRHLDPEVLQKLTTQQTGGIVGDIISTLMLPYLGVPGTGLILTSLLLSLIVLISQVNPIFLLLRLPMWISDAVYHLRIRHADRIKQLELERKRIEKESRRLERQLRRFNRNMDLHPSGQRPEPRIIDTIQPNLMQQNIKDAPTQQEPETPSLKITPTTLVTAPEEDQKNKSYRKQSSTPAQFKNYQLPPLDLLTVPETQNKLSTSREELTANQQRLLETLAEFGIKAIPGDITRGATITRYEIYPAKGVRVDRITCLNRDIARAMRAESVSILAPVPGKDSIAIDLPNSTKAPVSLRDLLESPYFKKSTARIPIALGKDVYGETLVADLASMPHLLIAGSTGSGKSVCINCIILSLLYKFHPEELRLILVDPKVVEMQCYNGLPHLVIPVVTDPKKVLLALRWVVNEMERRYEYLARLGVRNIYSYNARQQTAKNEYPQTASAEFSTFKSEENKDASPNQRDLQDQQESDLEKSLPLPEKLPYIVIIIDELADLMQTAPREVETAIARIAQKARAAGIHLVIATQTPRAQVITGVIKTNIPCRIAFQVPSSLDSRVILDETGAENLLGKGDMLYLPSGSSKLCRAQGAYVSEEEVQSVVSFITNQCGPCYENDVQTKISTTSAIDSSEEYQEDEELIERCIEVVLAERKASTSLLQRKLRLGYTRAARIMDILEKRGIVGPENGAKAREVLIQPE